MHTIGMTMNKIKIQQKVEMCRFNFRHAAIFLFLLIPLGAWAHGISDEDKQRMLDGGYLQYIELGVMFVPLYGVAPQDVGGSTK